MQVLVYLAIGLLGGVFAGMFGIGGGLIIVPALIFLMGFQELQATGTSLAALIPPVGLLGAIEYWRNGYIEFKVALVIAVGLAVGAYFGARIIIGLPPMVIRRIYGVFLLVVSARMLLGK
jgi:uncharacterized membrane protein YfcA